MKTKLTQIERRSMKLHALWREEQSLHIIDSIRTATTARRIAAINDRQAKLFAEHIHESAREWNPWLKRHALRPINPTKVISDAIRKARLQ